jgi:site-specific recombinase XerD
MIEPPPLSIQEAIQKYLILVEQSRSKRTYLTYQNALKSFCETLEAYQLKPEQSPASELPEDAVSWFAENLKVFAPATERLYLTAASNLYEYLSAENISQPNLARVRQLIRQRSRRPGVRLPQFPASDIDTLLEKINSLKSKPAEDPEEHLRNLRDRAFLFTLADTGLRVHEACGLRRGDLDWTNFRAVVIGKGNQQAVVRFSERAIEALRDYLKARADLDGSTGRPLASLPLFTRHDKGAGKKKVKGMNTNTGRNIVADRVREFLGEEALGTITPHSFRHYFVTRVLQSTNNLRIAQLLARHKSIAVTQRYSHLSDSELDAGYWESIGKKEE